MSRREQQVRIALQDAAVAASKTPDDFWRNTSLGSESLEQQYIQFSLQLPVNENVIFYESMSGERMNDNPFALFEFLRGHPRFGGFLHVWSLGKDAPVPTDYLGATDVIFARRGSSSYAYFLAVAGHVIGNANLPEFFTRRSGQRYLNTWHGVPYKALGRDTARAKFGSPVGTATFLKATHVITTCDFMTNAMLSAYSMAGASRAIISETGYPRVDSTLSNDTLRKEELRRELGTDDDDRPVVLYAPTWREEKGKDAVDTARLMQDLAVLAQGDIQLVYRGHHRVDRLLQDEKVGSALDKIIIPPAKINSNELLSVVDVLITDYSSIFFDFLPTGRPILHYLYDLEEYEKRRGLNLRAEELPGTVVSTVEELASEITVLRQRITGSSSVKGSSAAPLQGEKYLRAQARFVPHEDGKASQRAAEFFFKGRSKRNRTREPRDGRPTVAFWAGALRDDLASQSYWEQLLESGRDPSCQTVLVIDRGGHVPKESVKAVKALGLDVATISYNFREPTLLQDEQVEYERFIGARGTTLEGAVEALESRPALFRVFSRNYSNRMDDSLFDRVVPGPWLSNYEIGLAATNVLRLRGRKAPHGAKR